MNYMARQAYHMAVWEALKKQQVIDRLDDLEIPKKVHKGYSTEIYNPSPHPTTPVNSMELERGIEPLTYGLRNRCSTN
jgi:hypothetical protein